MEKCMIHEKKRSQKSMSFVKITSMFLCVLFCTFMFSASFAQAEKVHLNADFPWRPVWSTGTINVEFKADEKICKDLYGNSWEEECYTWLGKTNVTPQGIIAKDWPEGYWQWTSAMTLTFYPTSSWESDTTYRLDLSKLVLPENVVLGNTQISFTSIPRSAQMLDPKVWIDPSAKAEHVLSFTMDFTESIKPDFRSFLEKNAQVKVLNNSGLKLGSSEWVWLSDNTRAIVNAKVLALPKDKSNVAITLPRVRPLYVEDNQWQFPDREAYQELIVPGTDSLLSILEVKTETWQNKNLAMEEHLVFRFSQRVKAEELLKAITILELPLYRSAENVIPSNWKEGGIDETTLQNARKIVPQLVQLPNENAEYVRFRLDTSPEHYILWNIPSNFGPTNDKGVKTALGKELEGVEYIAKGYPRLDLLQAGNVLMLDSDLALISEHIDTIKWSAHRFKDNSLALPFINSLDDVLSDEQLNESTIVSRGEVVLKKDDAKNKHGYASSPTFTTLASKDIFTNKDGETAPGLVYLSLEGIKDGEVVSSYGRLLMYSNMGLVLKELPDSSIEAYVCYLDTAKALSGVRVQVLGYNGMPIAEANTDGKGKAILPKLENFSDEKKPAAVVIRRSSWDGGEDILWMSLLDHQRYVNMSGFMDLEGRQSSTNSLNAFVFAERGIFRPGDTLNFGTLLRSNDWKLLPENLPLVATVFDTVSRKMYQESFVAGNNIESFSYEIPENVPTGQYRLVISTPSNSGDGVGIILGSTTVQVDSFVPDTMKISTSLVSLANPDVPKDVPTSGWLVTSEKAGDTALKVQLKTLFGQVAANRRVASTMSFYPANINFAGYQDYTFQDVTPYFSNSYDPITRTLKSVDTDNKGQAFLPLDFSQWRFGTLQCFIKTEGFEPDGGRSVMQEKRFLLSPMPYMIGYKPGEYADNMDFIIKGNPAKLQLVAVDSTLKTTNPKDLQFVIAKRQPVTSLTTDSLGRYHYTETTIDTEIGQSKFSFNDDGSLIYDLPTKEVGEFLLIVKQADNKTLARVPFSVVGNDDLRPALWSANNLPPAKLNIKSDKKAYNGGETAQIMVNSPYEGVALLTLERDTVVSHAWVEVPMGSSMHKLEIPKEFVGRGYIQVLMGRSPKSDAIFLQPQSFAMTPITVNTDSREIKLKINAQDKVMPGKALSFNIKNTSNRPVEAIVFAVDEGILQLSTYRTPNPLSYLLLDRALEVFTAQLFDRTMPQDDKIMKRLSAFGGGSFDGLDPFAALLGSFQNPFKRTQEAPVAWWSGVIEVPASGMDLEIPIPSYYNGNLRIMAVATSDRGVGSIAKNVFVQADQVITPQLPAMAALGDNFDASIAVTNTTDKAINLKTSYVVDSKSMAKDFKLINFPQNISLGPKEEKLLPFKMSIGNEPGEAIINFTTQDEQGRVVERAASLSIRPAVLPYYSNENFVVNQSTKLNTDREMLSYGAETSLTLSSIPIPLLRSSLSYLDNYPYDCVEQIISKAFPLAILKNTQYYEELANNTMSLQADNLEKTIKNANNVIISAYNPYNGMSMWTDRSIYDIFLTAYAADYILELIDANMPVPPGFVPQIFTTLENQLRYSPHYIEDARAMAYATWVLARAGYVVTSQLEMLESYNREFEISGDVINSLMAGAYQALFMKADAQRHLDLVSDTLPSNWKNSSGMFDKLSQYGLHAVVLAKHFPSEFKKAMPFLQDSIYGGLNAPHATLGASMAARALLEILEVSGKQDSNMKDLEVLCAKYSVDNGDSSAVAYGSLLLLDAPNCTAFDIKIPKGEKVFSQIQNYGYDTTVPTEYVSKGISLDRYISFANDDEANFDGIVDQGDVLRVDVEVSLTETDYAQVAIVDLLPGGFELVLNHEGDTSSHYELSLFRQEDRVIAYIDAFSTQVSTITYHIRAITKGDFTHPAVYAEGLFDRTLRANTPAEKIKVVSPE